MSLVKLKDITDKIVVQAFVDFLIFRKPCLVIVTVFQTFFLQ